MMKRRILYFLCGLFIVLIIFFAFKDFFVRKFIIFFIKPRKDFDEIVLPAQPDYSRPESWAALPDRKDNADVLPAGDFSDNQTDAPVDVFFLHPTTFYSRKRWNQPINHSKANEITDKYVLRNQASVFNGSGRVYAPRYRQATLYSFLDEEGNGAKALELAYSDVKSAFEYYLEHYNEGRPIILASHSQGSRHGLKLLEDYFSGKRLLQQLVAAYLVGWGGVEAQTYERFPDIPVCESPDQTGCWMTWNSMGPDGDRSLVGESAVCVNPLTWTSEGALAGRELNLGGLVFRRGGGEPPVPDIGVVDAQCVDGMLLVSRPKGKAYSFMPMGRDNYHIYDYGLFYMNIRKNAQDRVAAYLDGLNKNSVE